MKRGAGLRPLIMLFLLFLIAIGAVFMMVADDRAKPRTVKKSLLVYCNPAMKATMEEIGRGYDKESGVTVVLQLIDSSIPLAQVKASRKGDLFLIADDRDLKSAQNDGSVQQTFSIAAMRPVIAVRKGNPGKIQSLDDLLRVGVQIAQADPDSTAVGRLTRPALESAGYWDKLKPHTRNYAMSVNDVGSAIKLGTVDAGFVWDATVKQLDGLEAIDSPAFDSVSSKITLGVLSSSNDPPLAIRFAQYVTASEKGLKVFERNGFNVIAGDQWTAVPQFHLNALARAY